jgi:hypothetical protein
MLTSADAVRGAADGVDRGKADEVVALPGVDGRVLAGSCGLSRGAAAARRD